MTHSTTVTKPESDTPTPQAPRKGTKLAKLVNLLARKNGVTLVQASETLGWQKHSTSAALTGLRKRGYLIKRQNRANKDPIYRSVEN
ncbi:MAG: DUF3489 domain-containing protein [Pseudomonadota bacterium]